MISRRHLLKTALLTPLAGTVRADAPRNPLSEQDRAAKALGYRQDARSVDTKAFPAWHRGESCANCALIEFGTARQRGCSLFPGKLVAASGWCSGWRARG